MENLPALLYASPILISLFVIAIFNVSVKSPKGFLIMIGSWVVFQAVLSLNNFYLVTDVMPPRFLLALIPPAVLIIILLTTKRGKHYTDSLSIKWLTLLHVARLPVELMLFVLYQHKDVPALMTFEGRNFDILSGISAPFIYYLSFIKRKPGGKFIIAWNIICLLLLLNIVINAILAAPFPFQQFAFDQPNIALLYFPFILLPCCIVPLVLYAHLAVIRQLIIQPYPLPENE